MSTQPGDASLAGEEDRLPWLETVDDDYEQGPSVLRIVLLALLGLALVAGAIYAYARLKPQAVSEGSGELINAQEGDYKVKPDQPGGMQVEGEGDTVFAASQGSTTNASIDAGAVPEAPVAGKVVPKARPTEPAGSSKVVAAVPSTSGSATPRGTPVVPRVAPAPAGSGSALVQIGSFPDEGGANAAWARLSKRFAYLAPLGKSTEHAEVNGRKVVRLRVNAGSNGQAREICGKLKVAGEACFVVN